MSNAELIDLIKLILSRDKKIDIFIDENSELINSGIDSMNLVQICLALEEKSLIEGFSFDWTSEKAISSLNSIFKSPASLTSEYNRQRNTKRKKE